MSARIIKLALLLFLPLSGCVSKDIVSLSMDVSQVQDQVSDKLNKSIEEELKFNLNLDEKGRNDLRILADHLDYLKRGNKALSKSLMGSLNSREISELIRERSTLKEEK